MKVFTYLKYFKTNQFLKFNASISLFKYPSLSYNIIIKKSHNERNYENNKDKFNLFTKNLKNTLLCGTLVFSIKEFFENDCIKLDDDPLKDLVKQSWLHAKWNSYEKAIGYLHKALELAYKQKNDLIMTRIYLEMADIFVLSKNDAEDLYKLVLQRLTNIHNISNFHPSYITTSIKLASVLAEKGNIRDADIGFKHCILTQKNNVLKIEKDLNNEINNEVLTAKALYGYALNAYAQFLIKYGGEKLISEAQMYIDNAIDQSNIVFGKNSTSTLHLINNFCALCIMNNYFEIAKEYLEKAIKSIEENLGNEEILVGMYCNYAEALYHLGNIEESLTFANKGLLLSEKCSKEINVFTANYTDSLKKTIKNENIKEKKWFLF
ncbi:Tetratricopeptide-like helical domain and Tetratricopeptide repeat-containing protein [Strongyloides ratti]|uniref:Tetratricopeptide-like helical domain and Tetratricopeptide repeat-containing protein n=1 Tax=Strongyloides ratti TaxID=34506 RepID=A0A090KPQ3_STRRB|nr:Tetratricopeptide-like helical domain and Tetratricopeptide repeat-containing protein [Strongyloides ratti]CEF59359.1 Tetratricopeptide-like helical domain and Tetratricopeptide repeat-containing protein [Strongyloides ratti]